MYSYLRIKKVRNTLGLKPKEMAEAFDINVNSYYNIENDKTKGISDKIKIILVNKYDVNINWLLTGKGTMFTKNQLDPTGIQNELEQMNKNLKEIKSQISNLK